jgi:plastocyanin
MDSKIAVAVGLAAVLAAVLAPISTLTPAFAAEVQAIAKSGSSSLTTDAYDPNPININVGDTVIWTNRDSQPHTVTSGIPSEGPDGKFDSSPNFSPLWNPGQTFSHTFTEAGEFPYYCGLHPNMVGTVIVASGGGPEPEPTPQEFSVTATADGNNYEINGKSATSKATEATIQSGQSVTIKFDKAGEVELTLPKSMISGINSVMAGNQELLDGEPTENADSSTISFTVPEGSTTVVIKGATVVPEFPVIVAILAATIAGIIGYTRFTRNGTGFFGRA